MDENTNVWCFLRWMQASISNAKWLDIHCMIHIISSKWENTCSIYYSHKQFSFCYRFLNLLRTLTWWYFYSEYHDSQFCLIFADDKHGRFCDLSSIHYTWNIINIYISLQIRLIKCNIRYICKIMLRYKIQYHMKNFQI